MVRVAARLTRAAGDPSVASRMEPRNQGPVDPSPSEGAIRAWCLDYLARTLDLPEGEIDPQAEFARLGLDSASSIHFLVALEEWLGRELAPELIVEYPTVAAVAHHLATPAGQS